MQKQFNFYLQLKSAAFVVVLTMESPEGKATSADLANFATGGVTFMFGMVEN